MSKIIFISNSLADMEKVKEFAKKSAYTLEHYSKEEWKAGNKRSRRATNQKKPHLSIVPFPTKAGRQTMNEIKVEAIKTALLRAKGNASKAADMLQIGRATLYRKIKYLKFNLESVRNRINEEETQRVYKKVA